MTARPPGRVRIVAGAKRGRRILVPRSGEVRPTGEKVREAIFDALGPVGGLAVLDLFAGSGAMGLEALSRGAYRCVFVERDRSIAGILRENISALEYEERSMVMVADFATAAGVLARQGSRFHLLFVDPPYRILHEVEVVLGPLLPSLLEPDGIAVVEGGRSTRATFGRLPVFERVYGDTKVIMLTNEED